MQKSIFELTMQELDNRVSLFSAKGIYSEHELYKPNSGYNLKSVSDMLGQLCHYDFDTAIDPRMRSIYEAHAYGFKQQKEAKNMPNLLDPPSDGEESITQKAEFFEPSFHWILKRMVDSRLLKYDSPEPVKVESKVAVPESWVKCKELIIRNVSKGFFLSNNSEICNAFVKGKLDRYPPSSVRYRKSQQIYYKGGEAILCKFKDEVSAMFAYYSMKKGLSYYKEFFGPQAEVNRVCENKLHDKSDNWMAIIIRKLPLSASKDSLASLLRKGDIKFSWLQELVQVEEYKYALVGIEFLDEVFKTVDYFKNPTTTSCKDFKVNLHPQSMKIWDAPQQDL